MKSFAIALEKKLVWYSILKEVAKIVCLERDRNIVWKTKFLGTKKYPTKTWPLSKNKYIKKTQKFKQQHSIPT